MKMVSVQSIVRKNEVVLLGTGEDGHNYISVEGKPWNRIQPPSETPVFTFHEFKRVLNNLIRYAENRTCTHERTYRGGVIWAICEDCGMRWADDRGGKPSYGTPKEIEEAIKFLGLLEHL